MKLFEALGFNWKILLAQFINFAVLIWVLNKFGYKPIIKFIEERRKKIEAGIENATLAEEKLKQANEKEKEIIISAKKEGQRIIGLSQELARKDREEIIRKTEEEARNILELSSKKAEHEKEKILNETKGQIAELAILATEKIISEKVKTVKDNDIAKSLIGDRL